MKTPSFRSQCVATLLLGLSALTSALAQDLTLTVTPKVENELNYLFRIGNETDHTIKIRGIGAQTGRVAPYEPTDTFHSPFMEGSIDETASPYFEVTVTYAHAPASTFLLPADPYSRAVQTKKVSFVFVPCQTFTFTRALREKPFAVSVSYLEAYGTRKVTLVWQDKDLAKKL